MKFKVKHTNKGFSQFFTNAKKLNDYYVSVGYLPESPLRKDAKIDNVSLAFIHEGLTRSKLPVRSVVRVSEEQRLKLANKVQEAIEKSVDSNSFSKFKQDMLKIGDEGVAIIRDNIKTIKEPPLAMSTIMRKKSDKLLVETTQYKNAIRRKIRER